MNKGIILLANGFEDTEAITTIDILRRAKIEIETVAINDNNILTQSNIQIKTDRILKDVDLSNYDFIIIPGGKAVETELSKKENVDIVNNLIMHFYDNKKLIAAICAAPSLLGKLGLLENKEYTCFKGFEKEIKGKYSKKGVVVSDNIITGKAMGYTIEFALEIVKYLLNKETKERINDSILSK